MTLRCGGRRFECGRRGTTFVLSEREEDTTMSSTVFKDNDQFGKSHTHADQLESGSQS
jgi:hypothetical protein